MLHRCNEYIGPKLTLQTRRLHWTNATTEITVSGSLSHALLTEASSVPDICPATACLALSSVTLNQAPFQRTICPVPMERDMGRKGLAQLTRTAQTCRRRFLIGILPAAVVAPLYFQGKIEFGVVNQSSSAFNHILSDVSLVVFQVSHGSSGPVTSQ